MEPCSSTLGALSPMQTQGLHLPQQPREHTSQSTGVWVSPARDHSCKAGGREQSNWDDADGGQTPAWCSGPLMLTVCTAVWLQWSQAVFLYRGQLQH